MFNQLLNWCLSPYVLLVLSMSSVTLSIVNQSLLLEWVVLLLFAMIMVLIAFRGYRTHHVAFSSRVLPAVLILILVSVVWDGLFFWHRLPLALRYTFFVGAALIRLSIFSYGWLLLVTALAKRQKVTQRTIVTAIIGYLFIGIIWSFIYLMLWQIDPQAFHISVIRDDTFKPWNLVMYFSFMTLTTVGYGDVIPVNRWAMALANFEAMIGAIYLAVIIARLVSLYGTSE